MDGARWAVAGFWIATPQKKQIEKIELLQIT